MQLCFQNDYITKMWVACGWPNDGMCAGIGGNVAGWESGAWWELGPGDGVNTDVWTSNRYFYAYAESEDGRVWGGSYGPFGLIPGFEVCAGIPGRADGDPVVGMQQVDAGWWHWSYITYTLTFL
jgi:hypothetical protein